MKRQKMTSAPSGLSQHQLDLPILPWDYYKDTFRSGTPDAETGQSLRKVYNRHLRKLEKKLMSAKKANVPHWKARIAYVRLDLAECLQGLLSQGEVSEGDVRVEIDLALSEALESDYHVMIYRALVRAGAFSAQSGRDEEAVSYYQRAVFYSYHYGSKWPDPHRECFRNLSVLWAKRSETHVLAELALDWQMLSPEKSVSAWRDHYRLLLQIGRIEKVGSVVAAGLGDDCELAARYLGALCALGQFPEAEEAALAALVLAEQADDDEWMRVFEDMPYVIERGRAVMEDGSASDNSL